MKFLRLSTTRVSKRKNIQNTKKAVSFKANASVREYDQHQETEIDNFWYTNVDAYFLHQEINETKNLMKSECRPEEIEELGYCTRGLEDRLRVNITESKRRRKAAHAIVSEAQSIKTMSGSDNTQSMAETYCRSCQSSVDEALYRARLDEEYVRKCEQEETSRKGVRIVLSTIKSMKQPSHLVSPPRKSRTLMFNNSKAMLKANILFTL